MEKESHEKKIAEDTFLKEVQSEPQEQTGLSARSDAEQTENVTREELESKPISKHLSDKNDVGPEYELIQKHSRFVSASWAVILFLLGLTMVMFCFASVVAWPWQMSWPTVQGKVVEVGKFTKNSCRYTYEYPVDGQTIHGFAHKSGSLYHTVKERDSVTIRYNPNKVVESYMQGGFNILETPLYVLVSFLLFVASWGFARGKFNQWQYKTFPIDELKQK